MSVKTKNNKSTPKKRRRRSPDPKTRFNIFYLFLALWGVFIIQQMWRQYSHVEQIPYSQFQAYLKQARVTDIVISKDKIRGKLKDPKDKEKQEFITTRVELDLAKELDQHGIKYTRIIEDTFFRDILSWVLPVLLFFGLWIFLIRRMAAKGGMGGSFMAIGKSKAKIYVEDDTKVSFDDVAGVDEAKEELQEVVNFLKDPTRYSRLGGKMPKGILLVGPPGTGKTLLARAVAGQAGVPFFSISGSEFVEMFVGVGAARVRDLFEQARSKAPCIIFIDELDALGKARNSSPYGGGHDEKEQTLNQLLVELDGFDAKTEIVLLSATNRPEILDPALMRAGRFDRQVLVDRPDKKGREQILNVHIKKIKYDSEIKLTNIAALTAGFTGADLANLVNEAALIATRDQHEKVTEKDFTRAIERIVAGLEKKNRILNPKEKEIVAYHEMGHALVAASLPGSDAVHKVSVIPRGIGALGYTIQRPTEDRFLMTINELKNKMAILMGGRAAEFLIFNHLSTGAADDISKMTDIARSMVTQYGMDGELGHVTYRKDRQSYLGQSMYPESAGQYGQETASQVDHAIKTLCQEAFDRALAILKENEQVLELSAQALIEHETLEESQLMSYFEQLKKES